MRSFQFNRWFKPVRRSPSVVSWPLSVTAVILFTIVGIPACAEHVGKDATKPIRAIAPGKPFERVLVITGFGMDGPVLSGVIDGLEKNGHAPDLIIAGCGASIPAGLANVEPSAEKRLEFLMGKEFFETRAAVVPRPELNRFDTLVTMVLGVKGRNLFGTNSNVPNIYQKGLFDVPQKLGQGGKLDVPFSNATGHVRVIILCGRANFTAEDVGRSRKAFETDSGKKMFTVVAMSDADTLAHLEGFEVPLAKAGMSVDPKLELKAGKKVCEAVRCSIADPYLLDPAEMEDGHYLTGAIDHHPIELAEKLGKKIYLLNKTHMSDVERSTYKDVFGINIDKRHDLSNKARVDYRIDLTDMDEKQLGGFTPGKEGLNFSIDVDGKTGAPLSIRGPKEHGDAFTNVVKALHAYGFKRAQEAVSQEPFTNGHIRFPKR